MGRVRGSFGELVWGARPQGSHVQASKLRQTSNVSNYYDQFEYWLGRIDITKEYAVSFYLNGLKPVIQQQVRMFMPKTLNQAYILAKL